MVIQGSVAFVWNTLILWWRTFAMRFLWFLGWEGQALLSLAVWCGLGEGFGEDLSFPWVHDQCMTSMTRMIPYDPLIPLGVLRSCKPGAIHWCQVLNRGQNHMLWWFFQTSLAQHSHGFSRLQIVAEVVTYSFTVAARETDFSILKASNHFLYALRVENDLMRVWLCWKFKRDSCPSIT